RRFGTIADCLAQVILNDRSAIVTYDRGAGIGFSDRDVENDFKTVLKAYDKLGGTNLAQVQPRDPDRALQLIETYLRYQLSGNPRFSAAVMIDYGETVAPAGEPGQLPAEDRELIRDFQPPSYPLELEYQRLIAAFECTSRQLLPPDLAAVPPEAIGARLAELRAALGKSA